MLSDMILPVIPHRTAIVPAGWGHTVDIGQCSLNCVLSFELLKTLSLVYSTSPFFPLWLFKDWEIKPGNHWYHCISLFYRWQTESQRTSQWGSLSIHSCTCLAQSQDTLSRSSKSGRKEGDSSACRILPFRRRALGEPQRPRYHGKGQVKIFRRDV